MHVVALEPSAGPVPPPTTVVIPDAKALTIRSAVDRHPTRETYLRHELRANVMNVDVESSRSDDQLFASDNFSA